MIRKTVFAMTTTALCLSLSEQASATSVFGISIDESTRIEQFEQIRLQNKELSAAFQAIQSADIAAQATDIMEQMNVITEQTQYILEEQPPAELTTCKSTMSTRQFRDRMDYRNDYSVGVTEAFAEILADLTAGEQQLSNLSNSLALADASIETPGFVPEGEYAVAPTTSSIVTVQQASVLADAAEFVQQQREITREIMVQQEDKIDKQLEDGDACAIQAHTECVTTGNCPDGESLTEAEEQARASGMGPPSMSDIGITEHGVVLEENSGALANTDGTTAILSEVQSDGSLKVVRTYYEDDGAKTCAADVAQMNDMSLGAYFNCY